MKKKTDNPFWFYLVINCKEDKEYAKKSYEKFGEILKESK